MRLDLVGNLDSHDLQQFFFRGCICNSQCCILSTDMVSSGCRTRGLWKYSRQKGSIRCSKRAASIRFLFLPIWRARSALTQMSEDARTSPGQAGREQSRGGGDSTETLQRVPRRRNVIATETKVGYIQHVKLTAVQLCRERSQACMATAVSFQFVAFLEGACRHRERHSKSNFRTEHTVYGFTRSRIQKSCSVTYW